MLKKQLKEQNAALRSELQKLADKLSESIKKNEILEGSVSRLSDSTEALKGLTSRLKRDNIEAKQIRGDLNTLVFEISKQNNSRFRDVRKLVGALEVAYDIQYGSDYGDHLDIFFEIYNRINILLDSAISDTEPSAAGEKVDRVINPELPF